MPLNNKRQAIKLSRAEQRKLEDAIAALPHKDGKIDMTISQVEEKLAKLVKFTINRNAVAKSSRVVERTYLQSRSRIGGKKNGMSSPSWTAILLMYSELKKIADALGIPLSEDLKSIVQYINSKGLDGSPPPSQPRIEV